MVMLLDSRLRPFLAWPALLASVLFTACGGGGGGSTESPGPITLAAESALSAGTRIEQMLTTLEDAGVLEKLRNAESDEE